MRSALERTAFAFKDIADQPDSPYVMLVNSPSAGNAAYAVDTVRFSDHGAVGYRDGRAVCAFTPHAEVIVLERGLFDTITQEGRIRASRADFEAQQKLMAELDPETHEIGEGVQKVNLFQVREALRRHSGDEGPFPASAYR